MRTPYNAVCTFSVCVALCMCHSASSQEYPSKPIRMVTAPPGGSGDVVARLLTQGLSANLGQQVIIDNRGGGIIPVETVAKAAPDGYTILVFGNSLWLAPFLREVPWDPIRDFAPVTLAVNTPNMLVVHPSLPVKDVRSLIAFAKTRPGQLNYGSASTGSQNHLAAELFKHMAGVDIVRIPYKGAAIALSDLIGGQVQLMFPTATAASSYLKSGRLRALAVTSAQPSALAPGLPTVAASGLPGYEAVSIYAVFAPAKTPAAIVNRLNRETVRVLNTPEVKDKFFSVGVEVVASTPEAFAAAIKAEMSTMGKLIKDAGIRGD
jgi:tripartite-type tricarboxylate transporter receptor subunit TctC